MGFPRKQQQLDLPEVLEGSWAQLVPADGACGAERDTNSLNY